jgi:hypothetical protein
MEETWMTVTPGSQMPPAAAPKPANRRGLMIGIGVAVVLCLCVCIAGVVLMNSSFGGAFSAAAGITQTCVDRTGLDAGTCGTWVQNAGSNTISTCISTQMTEGTTVTSDSLYDCLVESVGEPQ